MTPDQYCQDKAAQSGSSFYYSFMFLPPERRRAIVALYAFCREVDDVVDGVADREVARAKLAWWRREIAAAYDGEPQHPVARALRPVVAAYGLPQADLQTVIDGMAMDLDHAGYVDFAALEQYCHRVVHFAAEGVQRGDRAAPLRRQEQEAVVEARSAGGGLVLAVLVRGHVA